MNRVRTFAGPERIPEWPTITIPALRGDYPLPDCQDVGLPRPSTSNDRKYRTGNPVVRALIDRFYQKVAAMIAPIEPVSVLDVGCGEGQAIEKLGHLLGDHVVGCDINPLCIEFAASLFPGHSFRAADVYELTSTFDRFDLVLCLEVLEHLHDPRRALQQLAATTTRHLILSVPHEPYFRAGSLLRGKHLIRLGNHPEHLQSWNVGGFSRLLKSVFSSVEIDTSFPWIIAQCRQGSDVPQACDAIEDVAGLPGSHPRQGIPPPAAGRRLTTTRPILRANSPHQGRSPTQSV